MKLSRRAKYYYLRFIRLRGEPRELALGMALGIFAGMMPIMPFHMALSIALALVFKGSKITAVLASWISNPLDWYILYYLNYKIGSFVLEHSKESKDFLSLTESIRNSGQGMEFMKEIVGASGSVIAAFLVGGLIMGVVASVPSYFIFLKVFRYIQSLREKRHLYR